MCASSASAYGGSSLRARRLQDALRDEVDESPVRRRRVGVVVHREPEVRLLHAGLSSTYSPGPRSFTTDSDKSA